MYTLIGSRTTETETINLYSVLNVFEKENCRTIMIEVIKK